MEFAQFAQWLQSTPFSVQVRSSDYYPLIEGTHVLSLGLAVGTILWFDLRLVGLAMRGESIRALYASLRPWILLGFGSMVISGGILFALRAADVWGSTYFRIKVVLLLMAAINILVYHFLTSQGIERWDAAARPPLAARLAGGISLLLWFGVIAAGRLVAYSL
jgi:uncharacterized membrane protein